MRKKELKYRVVENSFIAKLAAKKLKSPQVAITIGKTIYLHNTTKRMFLRDRAWLRHELEHVKQFKRYGFFRFLFLYLKESWQHGYFNNKFEKEARAAELLENN